MKILICNSYFYRRGGAETYTLALGELLKSRGHDVLFFAMEHPENLECDEKSYFVDYIDYPTLNENKSLSAAWAVLSRSIWYPEARRQIRKLIKAERPDIVHIQNIHAHITPAILPEIRKFDIPIVWTLHDFKIICPENSFYSIDRICEECRGSRFYRCAINRCKKKSLAASAMASMEAYAHTFMGTCKKVDRFVSPSKFLKSKFEEFGWVTPRIDFVRNFLPDLGQPSYGGKGYGVFTGMLREVKGVTTLLDALKKAGDPKFYIAGDGPIRQQLHDKAAKLGLNNLRFLGHLDKEPLGELVRDADFSVVPSEWYENCPYAVLELMAAGKPVIASELGGLKELVEHRETGMLFKPKDSSQLAESISALSRDPALAKTLGTAARKKAESEFGPDHHYDCLSKIYANVIEVRNQ
jgi:glycosyltransferase involved in cell wall biosynthesis